MPGGSTGTASIASIVCLALPIVVAWVVYGKLDEWRLENGLGPAPYLPPVLSYTLTHKWPASPDSYVLRFALQDGTDALSGYSGLATGVKAVWNGTDEQGEPAQLSKSYSPVSLPDASHLDLLVKSYPPRPGGGLGAFLCGLQVGQAAVLKMKAPRFYHGSSSIGRRWQRLGLVAAGTGIAPFVQMVRMLLADEGDETRISLLGVFRRAEDVLMRPELEALATAHPQRLRLTWTLTGAEPACEGAAWEGQRGAASLELARRALPGAGEEDSMIMVCGTDGFVGAWAGPIIRTKRPDGKKVKVQGPLQGVLLEAGFTAEQVFKF